MSTGRKPKNTMLRMASQLRVTPTPLVPCCSHQPQGPALEMLTAPFYCEACARVQEGDSASAVGKRRLSPITRQDFPFVSFCIQASFCVFLLSFHLNNSVGSDADGCIQRMPLPIYKACHSYVLCAEW